ncbi:MAG: DNA repair protein RecO [Patescibacteria group bacterium]
MSTFVTPAIPLRIDPFMRDDEVVTLYTRSHGKLQARIRGGQKLSSKLSQRFHVMQELDVMIAPGRHMAIVAGVQTRRMLPQLQTDALRRMVALCVTDTLNQITAENDAAVDVYDFVSFWLASIASEVPARLHGSYVALIVWRLLSKTGFAPDTTNLKHVILAALQDASIESEAHILIQSLPFAEQVEAGREALPIIESILEQEIKGLRVLRDTTISF